MVNQLSMDAIFKALADPTRRSIIERVSSGPLSVEVLSPYYQMSAPALSKHLRVLEGAKLISRSKESRNVIVSLEPHSLRTLQAWVEKYTKFWNTNFDALEKLLNK